MIYWTVRRFFGTKDQESNGLREGITIQKFSTFRHLKERERTLSWEFEMKMGTGVIQMTPL